MDKYDERYNPDEETRSKRGLRASKYGCSVTTSQFMQTVSDELMPGFGW